MEDGPLPKLHLELIELLNANNQREKYTYAHAFHLIEEDHKDTLPVFKRCLTTGSNQAREQATKSLRALITNMERPRVTGIRHLDKLSWYPYSSSNLLWAWNSLNVLDECGIPYVDEDNDILIQTNIIESIYPIIHRDTLGYPLTDTHWRGLAVMAVSNIRPQITPEEESHLLDYITWAGTHADVQSIIDLTRERCTYNATTLVALLEQRTRTATSLVTGLL